MDKARTPTHDSGILVEAASRHTPSSSAESFSAAAAAHLRDKLPTPDAKPRQREHNDISLEELEDYVMQRRDNDCQQLKGEYKVRPVTSRRRSAVEERVQGTSCDVTTTVGS